MTERFEIIGKEQTSQPEDSAVGEEVKTKEQLATEATRAEYVDYSQRRADFHNKYEMSRTEKALNKIRKFLNLPSQNVETQVTIAHADALAEKLFRDELLRDKQERQAEESRKDRAA